MFINAFRENKNTKVTSRLSQVFCQVNTLWPFSKRCLHVVQFPCFSAGEKLHCALQPQKLWHWLGHVAPRVYCCRRGPSRTFNRATQQIRKSNSVLGDRIDALCQHTFSKANVITTGPVSEISSRLGIYAGFPHACLVFSCAKAEKIFGKMQMVSSVCRLSVCLFARNFETFTTKLETPSCNFMSTKLSQSANKLHEDLALTTKAKLCTRTSFSLGLEPNAQSKTSL